MMGRDHGRGLENLIERQTLVLWLLVQLRHGHGHGSRNLKKGGAHDRPGPGPGFGAGETYRPNRIIALKGIDYPWRCYESRMR